MQFVDTHCHIHFAEFGIRPEEVISNALEAGVGKMICVGCSLPDSKQAVAFASIHSNVWASVGAHPHDGIDYLKNPNSPEELIKLASSSKVVAIGEIGLDYYRSTVPAEDQKAVLKSQLEATKELNLPYIFHIREAWDDFWQIIDKYSVRGVVHSFSADTQRLKECLERDFYIGLNGIMTFTKIDEQLLAAKQVPLTKLLLETDAPFLAPVPFRGTTCEPKHTKTTAEFLADLRDESVEEIAEATTKNAMELFKI